MTSSTLSSPFDSFRDAIAADDPITVDGVDDDTATLRLPEEAFDFETVFTAAQDLDLSVTAVTYKPDDSQFIVTATRNVTLTPSASSASDVTVLADALDSLATHRGTTDAGNPLFGVVGSRDIQAHELFSIAREHGYRPVGGNVITDVVNYLEIELERGG